MARRVLEVDRGKCNFFFQAEDGIRDYDVTGVQTCALPIYSVISILLASTACSSDCVISLSGASSKRIATWG